MVHAKIAKLVSSEQLRRQMLQPVRRAQLGNTKVRSDKCRVSGAVPENSMILPGLPHAKCVRATRMPVKRAEAVVVLRAPLDTRLILVVHLALGQQSLVAKELLLMALNAKPLVRIHQ
jgi:hypothetical protein